MMSVPPPLLVPTQRAAVVGANGLASNEWYEFFRRLLGYMQQTGVDPAVIASILARLDELEQDAAGNLLIQGLLSVEVQGTPANGVVVLQLVNDEAEPGLRYQYQVDPDGIKGWYLPRPDDVPVRGLGTYLAGPDGEYLIGPGNEYLQSPDYVVAVTQLADLPAAVAGVIQLANNTAYEFQTSIDLGGARLVCGTNNVLEGLSFAGTAITSTGLSGALITSASSLRIQSLGLTAATGSLFDLNNGAAGNLLVSQLMVTNTPTLGTIKNYANVVINETIFFNSANLTIDGTVASFVSDTCLWDGRTGQTTIIVPATAVITRRFRFLYGGFIVNPGETGINFSASATIPDESYILDNAHFSGGGTYLAGLTHTSNKATFFNCVGITNTSAIAQYYMTSNATATTIGSSGTFVKAAGTTTPVSALVQKFDLATSNRAGYTGASSAAFRVNVFASMTSGNNQNLRMRIAVNGTTLAESTARFQTSGSGAASNIGTQALISMVPTDYVEVFVANDTAANNITVTDLNVTVTRLN